ncbi:uncharacterized protein PGTG_21890 [Puccinia graminis f. sp. tritici CRL 75-36-700-3]|uniref:Reverse transcriptase domain-containing protein n=1 Tax=Puccinia graminis f. sp. tritici (strain CRL 75-36-700-3 / race SCCL) TaxID=418459 RepID=H6QSW3_PUCGT|nr:uncharacterized protein PGTG_21890 [Puccinia graminis f. sp. tritici CRL 75-36-700-3]EHS63852.1 hypothetical protein PGTG_21890 [Puccinia graminis f. sp. tritici CRL 75-36-700-3]
MNQGSFHNNSPNNYQYNSNYDNNHSHAHQHHASFVNNYDNNNGGNHHQPMGDGRKRFRSSGNKSETNDKLSSSMTGGSKPPFCATKATWPVTVSCEMNIEEWKQALDRAGLLPEMLHILEGFKIGFDQGIPDHKVGNERWFTPDNHSSAVNAEEKIQKSIKEEVEAGRMFGPFSHEEVAENYEFFRTSPLGSVVNADGKMRPINNLSFPRNDSEIKSVNSYVDKLDFTTTWDDFTIVSTFFRSHSELFELALFDWAKAYRQIPTRESQWKYLMVKDLHGRLYVGTRITFGGVAGCGSFGLPADAWKQIMQSEFDVVKIFRWVDNNLFVKQKNSSCDMKSIAERSVKLGVATSVEKCSEFAEEQKFIGFIWNGVSKTVRLPDAKLEKRKEQIREYLQPMNEFKLNQVKILAGRLNHVSLLLPQLRCYSRSVYRWMNKWKKKWATRAPPEDVIEDLLFWLSTLNSYSSTRLCPLLDPTKINWVGDASTSFGIGVLIGRRWSQLRLKENWSDASQKRTIAWLETVAIRIGILMLLSIGTNLKGRNFIVWTDNTTTENTLRSRKSRDFHSNNEWKQIQKLLITEDLDITPSRVTLAENISNGLSRGVQRPHVRENRVWFDIPDDLSTFMFHA